jgi:hypothetical protein
MVDDFSPVRAAQSLADNLRAIEAKGGELVDAMNEASLAKGRLIDAEQEATVKHLFSTTEKISAWKLKELIDSDTYVERKQVHNTESKTKILKQEYEMLIEINNNLKLRIRMAGDEMRNLNNNYGDTNNI